MEILDAEIFEYSINAEIELFNRQIEEVKKLKHTIYQQIKICPKDVKFTWQEKHELSELLDGSFNLEDTIKAMKNLSKKLNSAINE